MHIIWLPISISLRSLVWNCRRMRIVLIWVIAIFIPIHIIWFLISMSLWIKIFYILAPCRLFNVPINSFVIWIIIWVSLLIIIRVVLISVKRISINIWRLLSLIRLTIISLWSCFILLWLEIVNRRSLVRFGFVLMIIQNVLFHPKLWIISILWKTPLTSGFWRDISLIT